MIEMEQLRIELSSEEAEKIIADWVSGRMRERGYKMDYFRNEDGLSFPSTFWRGDKEKLPAK
jgi:hypothetical protein